MCVNVKSYLCRSLPALKETGPWGLCMNFNFYFIQVRKKRSNYYNQCYTWTRWYFTSLSTVQMAVFLTSQRAFTGHAISLQIPFKLLKIQPASCLLSIILWPLSPHLYFWWKPNFRFLPNQGTLLSGKKYWAIYAFDQKHLKCAQKQPSQKEKRTAA